MKKPSGITLSDILDEIERIDQEKDLECWTIKELAAEWGMSISCARLRATDAVSQGIFSITKKRNINTSGARIVVPAYRLVPQKRKRNVRPSESPSANRNRKAQSRKPAQAFA